MPLLFYPRLFGDDAAVAGGGSTAPNTPALSQPIDNGDGTGATASISGSSAGSTNTVYTAPWGSAGNNLSWTASATRVGDGTISLSLSPGFYAARCESVLASLPSLPSNEPLFQVTGGTSFTSVHKALAAAVQTKIQSLLGTSIIGVAPGSVRVRKTPYLGDFTSTNPLPANYQYQFPAIIVHYYDREMIDPNLGTNARDEIRYPITVSFIQETQSYNTPSEALDDQFLSWREAVERTFTNMRGVTGSKITVTAGGISHTFHKCFPIPGQICVSGETANRKLDIGWLTFSFCTWRGALGT